MSDDNMDEAASRRRRSDRISEMMSEYLLRGYKMLATHCPYCQNVVLQSKQGENICLTCGDGRAQESNMVPTRHRPAPSVESVEMKGGGVRGRSVPEKLHSSLHHLTSALETMSEQVAKAVQASSMDSVACDLTTISGLVENIQSLINITSKATSSSQCGQ